MSTCSGLAGFLQILKATQDYESSSGSYEGRLRYEGHAKDTATQMAGILALASRITGCRLATDIRQAMACPLLVGSNGAEVRNMHAFRRV